jgi:hypothetical protein
MPLSSYVGCSARLCARCINCVMSTRSLNRVRLPPSTEQPKNYLMLSCHVRQWSVQRQRRAPFRHIIIKLSTVLLFKMARCTKLLVQKVVQRT